jgi:non-ribosomal peptide synthetase component F
VTHGALAGLFALWKGVLGIEPKDAFLAASEPSLAAFVLEALAPLAAGARAWIPSDRSAGDLSALARLARELKIDYLSLPEPAALSFCASFGAGPRKAIVSFGERGLGGEALDPTLAREILKNSGSMRLVFCYGKPEGGFLSLCEAAYPERLPETLGSPAPNRPAYVMDRSGRHLPSGYPGELCLVGGGVSPGYLGDPALTARLFFPDPASGQSPAPWGALRLFRTGDLCRRRPDGRFDRLGKAGRGGPSLPALERARLACPGVIYAKARESSQKPESGTGIEAYASLYPLPSPKDRERLSEAFRARLFRDLPPSHVPDRVAIGGAPPLDAWGRLGEEAFSGG